ncbi:MAG TPA: hypothetical protein PKL03_00750 [Candidatus Omnitrophota bacterium]|nr:hypothetical protein [Candidatus Omnitrophota bacterium]
MYNKVLSKVSCVVMAACLMFEQAGFAQVAPQAISLPALPAYVQNLAPVADKFRPVHLRSISFDSENNNYNLLLDKGDTPVLQPHQTQELARKIVEYFEIGLRLPNSMFWVNLRPDAPDQIIDPYLAKTDVGRILLEADLQLKKDLSRLTSPDTSEGRRYWDALYAKAESLFGQEDAEVPTMTRPWIVPDEIVIGQGQGNAYILKATLKVMLEQDHLRDAAPYAFTDERMKAMNAYSSQLVRTLILPRLTREVNASRRYAGLRQVYYSLIAAQWHKKQSANIPDAIAKNVNSLSLDDYTSARAWSPETYYAAYRKSFSEGEYDREERVSCGTGVTIRRYFSGGAQLQDLHSKFVLIQMPAIAFDGGNVVATAQPAPEKNSYRFNLFMRIVENVKKIEEGRARSRGTAPEAFDPTHNNEHLRILRDHIRKQYCVNQGSDESPEDQLSRTNRNIRALVGTKHNPSLEKAFLKLLGGDFSEYMIDGPLLRAIFVHKHSLRWPLNAERLRNQYKINGNGDKFFPLCEVLEYLGIAKLTTTPQKGIIELDQERMELWWPQIRTYNAETAPKPPTDKAIFEARFLQLMAERQILPANQDAVTKLLDEMRVRRPDNTMIEPRWLGKLKRPFYDAVWKGELVAYMREVYKDRYGDDPKKRNGDLFDTRTTGIGPVRPSFAGTKHQPPRLDPSQPSKTDQLFDALWMNCRDSLDLDPIERERTANGYTPDQLESFRGFIYKTFVIATPTGDKYNWAAGKSMSEGKSYNNNFIRQIKRMLFPSADEPWEKKTLAVIYSLGDKDGISLTFAQIQKQFRQAGEEPIHVKNNINLEFLARLGLIDIIRVGRNKSIAITRVYKDRFELFYPDIAHYGHADAQDSDVTSRKKFNIARTILEMVDEKLADAAPDRETLQRILDAINAGEVASRLGVDQRDINPETVDARKREIRKISDADIVALKKSGPDAVSLYRDGGTDRKVAGIDLRSLPLQQAPASPMRMQRALPDEAVDALRCQWQTIINDSKKSVVPFDRIADYISLCRQQGAEGELAGVCAYIAALLRCEEDNALSTPQDVRLLLAGMQ